MAEQDDVRAAVEAAQEHYIDLSLEERQHIHINGLGHQLEALRASRVQDRAELTHLRAVRDAAVEVYKNAGMAHRIAEGRNVVQMYKINNVLVAKLEAALLAAQAEEGEHE